MIKPINTKILIEPDKEETQTESGILLADTVEKSKPMTGKVLSVGEDVQDIRKGDHIIFRIYAPDEVEENGKTYLILDIDDAIAIYEN